MTALREQIMQALVTRLRTITAANGYSHDVRQVIRGDTEQPTSWPAILVVEGEETYERENTCVQATMAIEIVVEEKVAGSVLHKGTGLSAWQEDLFRAIWGGDDRLGGLVGSIDPLAMSPTVMSPEDSTAQATFDVSINYTFRIANPAQHG